MPIVYIHGVAVRNQNDWPRLQERLRRYVAPVISSDPGGVPMIAAYWGDLAARYRYDRRSLPESLILGMGSERRTPLAAGLSVDPAFRKAMAEAVRDEPPEQRPSRLLPAGPGESIGSGTIRLSELTMDQLADLGAAVALEIESEGFEESRAWVAAEGVAYDPTTKSRLTALPDRQAELRWYVDAFRDAYLKAGGEGLVPMGVPTWLGKFDDTLSEVLSRAVRAPLYVASRVLIEMRRPLNNLLTDFFGDVFVYLDERIGKEGGIGPIPGRALEALRAAGDMQAARNGEPIVVLTHSMGGQVFYDQLTYFMPRDQGAKELRIAFWAAIASQVGLFEELKLHLVSDERYAGTTPVPFPGDGRLRHWWNVWDYNDVLSYSARAIFDEVEDESYDTGGIVGLAHSDYFRRPSFFRRFAERLKSATQVPARRA